MTNTSRRTPDYKINPKAFASPGYMDINIWPFLSVVSVLFIWAVNTISPGTFDFLTGMPFIDSLILGLTIGTIAGVLIPRLRASNFSIDEIAEIENELTEECEETTQDLQTFV